MCWAVVALTVAADRTVTMEPLSDTVVAADGARVLASPSCVADAPAARAGDMGGDMDGTVLADGCLRLDVADARRTCHGSWYPAGSRMPPMTCTAFSHTSSSTWRATASARVTRDGDAQPVRGFTLPPPSNISSWSSGMYTSKFSSNSGTNAAQAPARDVRAVELDAATRLRGVLADGGRPLGGLDERGDPSGDSARWCRARDTSLDRGNPMHVWAANTTRANNVPSTKSDLRESTNGISSSSSSSSSSCRRTPSRGSGCSAPKFRNTRNVARRTAPTATPDGVVG